MIEKNNMSAFAVGSDWNPLQSRLKEIILKHDYIEETKQLLYRMHSIVHSTSISDYQENSYMDEIWSGLDDTTFRIMPTEKDDTIAWNIWHITRIEDLTVNYLIGSNEQVLDDTWLKRLNTKVTDTGNAMTDPEIQKLSHDLSMEALYDYRNAVARRTREVIENLKPEDMKHKVSSNALQKISEVGGVTNQEASRWLLDFWGKKNVAGILLMPVTRHQIVHLNDCRRLKLVCKRGLQ